MLPKKKTRGLELSTFHSLGLKICKKFIDKLGYKIPFLLKTPSELELTISDLLKKYKINPKDVNLKMVLSHISLFKNTGVWVGGESSESPAQLLYEEYESFLKDNNSLDFDDLILKPTYLIENFPEVQEYYKKYKYFMIDEFQDTNETQYRFIKSLLAGNQNLCVVGDDDQSIYGFRGSNRNIILNFSRDFVGTKTIKLLQNYRSTTNILKAANSLIKKNSNRVDKELWSNIQGGEVPQFIERLNEKDEASFIADKILELKTNGKILGNEIAILFRTNFQSRPFEEELRMRSIPYKLIGAYDFFDRKEVKDMISYIRVIANHKDELSLLRIVNYPKRGLGQNSIFKIQEKAAELDISIYDVLLRICEEPGFIPEIKKAAAGNIYEFINLIQKYKKEFCSGRKMSEVMRQLVKDVGIEKEMSLEEEDEKVLKARMLNISELINMLSYFESEWEEEGKPTLFDFIVRLSLLNSDDDISQENREENKVQMMTMHLSKGLEFDAVFLVGLEEGIIPSSRSMETEDDISEERRLLYVGMTRAKKKLFLTSAAERKKFGDSIPSVKSRFLEEIDSNYIKSYFLEKPNSEEQVDFLDMLEKMKVNT
jgi:DNA helicase-2/ATP-dependent DNA helicase PcrA